MFGASASHATAMDQSATAHFIARVQKALENHDTSPQNFGHDIFHSLEVVNVEVDTIGDMPVKTSGEGANQQRKKVRRKARVVVETTVKRGWLNPVGVLHGAASAYLVDICTSFPLIALSDTDYWAGLGGLSQSMTVVYHAPAPEGTRLRIDSVALNVGKTVANMRCDITDAKTGRLLVSGLHTKVDAFTRKSKL